MMDKTFSISEAVGFGWKVAKSNFGFFFGILALWLTLNYIPDDILGRGEWGPTQGALAGLAFVVIQTVIGTGVIKISLRFCDNERPTYGDLFSSIPFFRSLLASLIYVLIVIAGLLLLLVPGIIWAIQFSFVFHLIVDKGLRPIDALRMSSAITKGAKWELLLFGVVSVGVNALGALVALIGLLWTIPTTFVASAYVYRKLLTQTSPALSAAPSGGQHAVPIK